MKGIAFFSLRTFRAAFFATVFGLAFPLSAHPAGDFLPDVPGPVTLLAPARIKDAPFLPDTKDNPLFLAFQEIQDKLEAKSIPVKVHSLAVFEDGFLMNSSATPATVRYILKYKLLGEQIAWAESGDADSPVFNLAVSDSGSFRLTFPAKDWLLCSVIAPPEPADDTATKTAPSAGENVPADSAVTLLKTVPDDAVMAYVWPEPGATAEYPLMGELNSISFHIIRDEKDSRPVHAEIVMPAKSADAALKIQTACRGKISQVYQEAAKLGKIPNELVNAFTVTRKEAEVSIRIALPDDMAKYLFTQFATALQEEVKPFAVPDKLK